MRFPKRAARTPSRPSVPPAEPGPPDARFLLEGLLRVQQAMAAELTDQARYTTPAAARPGRHRRSP